MTSPEEAWRMVRRTTVAIRTTRVLQVVTALFWVVCVALTCRAFVENTRSVTVVDGAVCSALLLAVQSACVHKLSRMRKHWRDLLKKAQGPTDKVWLT